LTIIESGSTIKVLILRVTVTHKIVLEYKWIQNPHFLVVMA